MASNHISAQKARIASDEREQLITLIAESPGITARQLSVKMDRSYASTAAQLRKLYQAARVKTVAEVFRGAANQPQRINHFYLIDRDDIVEERLNDYEMPKQAVVSVWVHDCPAPDPILAMLFGMVTT